ncbi:MAG: hypothetical protein JOZ46_02105 [Candidatus Dormibacteraeota bacterium]|nr:hypothetical protein [Candidatus Dormibacteraeota bacterium]MBV9524589.1 hypothetical protein [Candidatus Dormibacteraeota bacterium]
MAIQASKPNSRIFLLLGVVLAALAFGGVLFALRSSGGGQTVNIVVTTTNVPAGTALTAQMVTTSSVPIAAVPGDAFTTAASVVGKTTTVAVAQNTPLVPAFFSAPPITTTTTSSSGSTTPVSVETQITKGYVAMAIPSASGVPPQDTNINGNGATSLNGEEVSAGYYIMPGDHIDILVDTGSGGVRFGFQDVPVLRVGTAASGSGAPSVLIVEVPRSQAEMLTELVVGPTHPFVVKYVLRPQSEWGKMAPDNSTYTPNYENTTGPGVPTPNDPVVSMGSLDALFGR